jgi:cell fate (sporulation/competence/biofilm development) regulator YlbF (YheA/YmcA/DUF963 family)
MKFDEFTQRSRPLSPPPRFAGSGAPAAGLFKHPARGGAPVDIGRFGLVGVVDYSGGMPTTTQEIMSKAADLGKLVADHPAVAKYRQAQQAVANDPDAGRLMREFNRQLDQLARAEQMGQSITDAQRQQLESLQTQIVSHIKIKALNLAQVEFIDLLRKITQEIHRPLAADLGEAPTGAAPSGPRLSPV